MENLVNNILTANRRIKAADGGVRETPLDEAGVFSERIGATFLLKGEHLQRTGSFKLRGALNRVLSLNDEERKKWCRYFVIRQSRHRCRPGCPRWRCGRHHLSAGICLFLEALYHEAVGCEYGRCPWPIRQL